MAVSVHSTKRLREHTDPPIEDHRAVRRYGMVTRLARILQAAFATLRMNTEKEIKALEKNRRLSARAIPIYASYLVATVVALWVFGRFFTIPLWVTIIVLGIPAFTLVGDIYNYFDYGRKLSTLKQDHPA
jgi:hypothetical protein